MLFLIIAICFLKLCGSFKISFNPEPNQCATYKKDLEDQSTISPYDIPNGRVRSITFTWDVHILIIFYFNPVS